MSRKIFFLPLLAAFFGYLFFSVYEEVKEKAIQDFNLQQLTLARQAAIGIQNFFDFYLSELTDLSQIEDVERLNKKGISIVETFYHNHADAIRAVTRVDKDGRIIYTIPYSKDAIGADISQQSHVKTILQNHKPVVSEVFEAVQGYQAVAYHVPVFYDQTFQGTLAVLIPFERITREYLGNIKIGKTGHAWVVSQAGLELYNPTSKQIGKSVFDTYVASPAVTRMAAEMVKAKKGITTYTHDRVKGENVKVIKEQAVYLPIHLGNTFWSVVVSTPEEEILSTITGLRNRLLFIALLMALVGSFYSYSFVKARMILKEAKQREQAEKALQERARLATLSAEVGTALTSLDPLATMLGRCADAVVRNLEAAFARIWLLNQTTTVLELKASEGCYTHLDGAHSRVPLGELKIGRIAKERRPHLTNAVLGDPNVPEQDWARREGMVAFAGYPLVVEDRVLGVLALFSRKPIGDFTMKGLASVADKVALGVERKRAEERVADALRYSRTVIDSSPLAIITCHADGQVISANYTLAKVVGGTSEQLLAQNLFKLSSWQQSGMLAAARAALATGEEKKIEAQTVSSFGKHVWFDCHFVPFRYEGELRLLSLLSEISERKQTEEALRKSEERFRYHFDFAVIGKSIFEMDGRFIQVNQAFCEMLGYSEEEILQKRWNELVHPDHYEKYVESLQSMLHGRTPSYHLELKMTHKKGHVVWTRVNIVLVRDRQGNPLYQVGDIEDITTQYAYEAQLRKYERIVGTSKDQMSLVNRDYVYEAVNDSYLRSHGRRRDEIVGRTVAEVNGQVAFRETIKDYLDQAFSGQIVHYQSHFDFAGIGKRYMDVSYFPYTEKDGEVIGVVVHVKDITDTKEMEQRLIQSQKMESLGTLAGGVAHEINNPINGIMNYAQLIMDRAGKESQAVELAGEIIHETQRVATIVKNLLTFARHEKQSQSPAHLSDIISSVLSLIQTVMRHDQIELQVDIPVDLPKFECRSQQIQQVLMNLIANARDALNERYPDYSPQKQLRVCARLFEKHGRRYIRTTVEDFGMGIPAEIRDRIFDPFFTTKPKETGTGLGLSISYGIVKNHKGELIVESEPGQYTRFHMDLPVDNGWPLK